MYTCPPLVARPIRAFRARASGCRHYPVLPYTIHDAARVASLRRLPYYRFMIPQDLRPLFWDTNPDSFNPADYPDYSIFRVLELGDEKAIAWMEETFSPSQIVEVLRRERRLTRKSAN